MSENLLRHIARSCGYSTNLRLLQRSVSYIVYGIPAVVVPFVVSPFREIREAAMATAVTDVDGIIPDNPPASATLTHELDALDKFLLGVVSSILLLSAAVMIGCVIMQWHKYDAAIRVSLGQPFEASDARTGGGSQASQSNKAESLPPIDHSAALAYSRSLDIALIKTSALMLAFIVVFLGALYVLRTAQAAYQAGMSGGGYSGTLQTSSPGLVMVSLGTVLVIVTLLVKSDVTYRGPTLITPSNAAIAAPDQLSGSNGQMIVSPPAHDVPEPQQ